MTIGPTERPTRSFLWTQAAAIAFGYAHTIEDWYVGLFGTDRATLSFSAAALLALQGLVYAGWAIALARHADRAWLSAVFVFAFGWTFLTNGSAIVFCLPPCPALVPYGDIAHLGALVFGAWASVVTWRLLRRSGGFVWGRPAVSAIVLLVVLNVIASALSAEYINSLR